MKKKLVIEVMNNGAVKEITQLHDDEGNIIKKDIRFKVNAQSTFPPGVYEGDFEEVR